MKIRQGFVSNSSSSSFMLVGVKVSDLSPEQLEAAENSNLEFGGDNEEYVGVNHYIGEYETECFSLKELAKDELRVRCVVGEDVEVHMVVGMTYG